MTIRSSIIITMFLEWADFVEIFLSGGLGHVGQGLGCNRCDEDTLEGASVRVPRPRGRWGSAESRDRGHLVDRTG